MRAKVGAEARAKARAEVVPGPSEEPEPAQLRLVFDPKAEPGIAVEVEAKRSSRRSPEPASRPSSTTTDP